VEILCCSVYQAGYSPPRVRLKQNPYSAFKSPVLTSLQITFPMVIYCLPFKPIGRRVLTRGLRCKRGSLFRRGYRRGPRSGGHRGDYPFKTRVDFGEQRLLGTKGLSVLFLEDALDVNIAVVKNGAEFVEELSSGGSREESTWTCRGRGTAR
jgi:hypothetical protein